MQTLNGIRMIRVQRYTLSVILAGALLLMAPTAPIAIAGSADPAQQCAEGVELAKAGSQAEALPLLEAGFAGRAQTRFAKASDLGFCAEYLGVVRIKSGELAGALEALNVALESFRQDHDLKREVDTLNYIGHVHEDRHEFAYALDAYLKALETAREVGDQEGEGITLNHLGALHYLQGQYANALKYFQQALISWREVGDRSGEGATLNYLGEVHRVRGQLVKAQEYFQQSLILMRELGDRTGEGASLNYLGAVHYSQGQYTTALDYLQQALAIEREVGDRPGEGKTLHNISGIYYAQGQYTKALDGFQQALAIAREIADRPGELATLNYLGGVLAAQGQSAKALVRHQQALVIAREVGDRAGEGTTLGNIGAIYHAQGHFAKALENLQQALVIKREVGDRIGEGFTLGNIGAVYRAQGHFAKALENLQQALVIMREVGDRTGEGKTLSNIGLVYFGQGQNAKALESHQQALTVMREVGHRVGQAEALHNIASVLEAQGQYAQALESFQQALGIIRAVGNRADEGTSLNYLGVVYFSQGQYAKALDYFQQALAIRREVGDRAGEDTTLNNIGGVYDAQGQHAKALENLQQALAIERELGDRAGEGTTLGNIGAIYQAQGQYAKALENLQHALVIAREVGDRAGEGATLANTGAVYSGQGQHAQALESFLQALTIAREIGDRTSEGETLAYIGFVYLAQGQPVEALDSYREAMDVLETVRASAGSEQGRAGFIAQYAELYDRAAALYHQQGQDDLAFLTSERGRARAVLDSLATGSVQLSDQASANLLAREQEAYAARQAAQDALARARAARPPDPALVRDLEQQLDAANKQYDQASEAITQRDKQLASLIPGRTYTATVLIRPAVQKLLGPDTTLVSYMVQPSQTLAFVLTREQFHTVPLSVTRDALEPKIEGLRSSFKADSDSPTAPANAKWLYDAIIAPLKPYLNTPHLAIVPSGSLHYLPFAALSSDGESHFLIDDYGLTVLPSASSLQFIRKNTGRPQARMVVFGNPATPDHVSLPSAEDEAKAVAQLYGVQPLTGTQATLSALLQQVAQAGIVHLAAHGMFSPTDALSSTIFLAPTGSDDGHLTVSKVYNLNLKAADLVVLSACQTQLGEHSAGDELVGLTRAFIFAGTPSVLTTLWSVDDESTRELMEQFYTHLQAGMGKAEALGQAQREIRKSYPNAFYWAAFVLSGDPGAIPVTR